MIDRDDEQDWLRRRLDGPDREVLVVYGRRRVGKTTLVSHVLDCIDVPSTYYLCDERGVDHNAEAFAEQCAATFADVPPAVEGFEDAFRYLTDRVDGQFVVAFDEFSYLVAADEAVVSTFQRIVDELLEDTEISLVLLGSSISMMEEGVLSYESPLYGRRTGQWKLDPLTASEVAGFFPDYDAETLVQAYSVLGGIPAYLEQFDPDQSLLDNVEQYVLSKGAFLYEEPEFLLRQELREPATYMGILEAVTSGATRVTEIANEIGRDASSLSRYLKNLTELDLLHRETPVTDPDGRSRYVLDDQFLRFWFRYVAPNRSQLERGQTAPVRATVEETFPNHVSWTFEDVCRDAVRSSSVPVDCSRVGRWWYGEHEVDVAGINEQTETLLLGECRWTNEPVGTDVIATLEAIEPEVRWHDGTRSVEYALFSKSGFTEALQDQAADRTDCHLFDPEALLPSN